MAGGVRWFDGSVWTTHTVSSDAANPTATVQERFDPRSPEEMRRYEWEGTFASWDTDLARRNEAPFGGGGGWQGLAVNREVRLASRISDNLRHPRIVLAFIFALVFAILAWGDRQHRVLFVVCGGVALVATEVTALAARKSDDTGIGLAGKTTLSLRLCCALASSPTTVGSVRLSPRLRYRTGPPRTVRRLALSVSARWTATVHTDKSQGRTDRAVRHQQDVLLSGERTLWCSHQCDASIGA